jgi:hypothetical protein
MKFTDTSWCIVTQDRTGVLTGSDIIRPIVKNQDGTIDTKQTGSILGSGSKKNMQNYLIEFCNKKHLSVYDFRVVLLYTTVEDASNGIKTSQKISFKC